MPSVNIPDGFAIVRGRSQAQAKELLEAAEAAGLEKTSIRTITDGYIVPAALVSDEQGAETDRQVEKQQEDEAAAKAEAEAKGEESPFDPNDHSVAEVQEYLEGADDEERARVLDAEKAGQARKSLVGETK